MFALKLLFGAIIHLDMLLLFGLLVALILSFIKPLKHLGHKLFIICTIPLLIITLSPLPRSLFIMLENRFPPMQVIPENTSGFILLGGSLSQLKTNARDDHITIYNPAAARLFEFITLAREHPSKQIIITGTPQEARQAQEIMLKHGINKGRIISLGNANNTIENAYNTFIDMKPTPDQKWLLVTSAFHMPRAMGLFRTAGWNIEAFPVDYHSMGKINAKSWTMIFDRFNPLAWRITTLEWAGMTNNYLQGKSTSLFPH